MHARPNKRDTLNQTGQTLIRIVIASYFIASASGIIPGMQAGILFEPVLEPDVAYLAGAATVFCLAFLILTGYALRAAALVLSIMLFWSSYLTMIDLGLAEQLGFFWRDLALIGALMLTYLGTGRHGSYSRPFSRRRKVRHIRPTAPMAAQPEPVADAEAADDEIEAPAPPIRLVR